MLGVEAFACEFDEVGTNVGCSYAVEVNFGAGISNCCTDISSAEAVENSRVEGAWQVLEAPPERGGYSGVICDKLTKLRATSPYSLW